MPALAALLLITVTAASFEAKVIGVVDAETLDILDESKTTRRIRIHSLECSQPLAKKARSAMSALDAGQRVAVENLGDDRYGRVIAGIWTWHSTKYNHSEAYTAVEQDNAIPIHGKRTAAVSRTGLFRI